MAPLVKDKRGEYTELFTSLKKRGYRKVRIDGRVMSLDTKVILIKTNRHTIDLVVDSLAITEETDRVRLSTDIEQALQFGNGEMTVGIIKDASFDIPELPGKIRRSSLLRKICLSLL